MSGSAYAAFLDKNGGKDALLLEGTLPLVIEILPGQAAEGLIDIYEPGSFEGIPLRDLVYRTLSRKNWSIEEKQVWDEINRQMSGGKLLNRGREIHGTAGESATLEETEEGERYLYVSIRAIRPQEGG